MKHFVFFAGMLIAFGLISPAANAQGVVPPPTVVGCLPVTDTLEADVLISAEAALSYDSSCTLFFSGATPADNGWNVQWGLLCSSADTGTIFIPYCGAFSVDEVALTGPSDAHNVVSLSAQLTNEQGNTTVELLVSANGGENWLQAAFGYSEGDGDNTYHWSYAAPKTGRYLFQVRVTDINGTAGLSNVVEVYVTADPALVILNNRSAQPRLAQDGDASGIPNLDIINGAGQLAGRTGSRGEIPDLLPPDIYYVKQAVFGRPPLKVVKE